MDYASALEQCLLRKMDLMAFDSEIEKLHDSPWRKQSTYLKFVGFGKNTLINVLKRTEKKNN